MKTAITLTLVLLALASTFGAGLELRGTWDRRVVLRVLVVNVVLVPLLGWLVVHLFAPSEPTRLAVWLVAFAPGGASGPLLARSAGGPPATTSLAFLVLAVSSTVLLPAGLWWQGQPLPSASLALVVAVQLVPLTVGASLASKLSVFPALPARLRRLGNGLLVIVVALLLVDRGPALATLGALTHLSLGTLVLVTALSGALVPGHRIAFSILTMVRNLSLALLVSEALEAGAASTLIVATYGLLMYGLVGVLMVFARKAARDGTQEAQR